MMIPSLRARVQAVLPEAIALRHDLHAHPELSGAEARTARVVSEALLRAGIPHETSVGGTHGIVATVEGKLPGGRTVGLRGDMDALPIYEENDVAYKSTIPGAMHACGHDGHTANLLGVALVLNGLRDQLAGSVRFIFQPAEETVRGADALIEAGAIEGVDAMVALHGWPNLEIGQIGLRSGPFMASSDHFQIEIRGRGGHAAYPHDTVDPILVGAQVVQALQTVVAREITPTTPAVVSVTQFHAGTAKNIIPGTATLGGTIRALDPTLRQQMPALLERIIGGVCSALRAEYAFDYGLGTPVTVNDAAMTDLVRAVGRDLLGAENVIELAEPTMGAEDFAYYCERVPGVLFRLGTGCPYLLHTPRYDFGDAPLETGIALMVETACRFLQTPTVR